MTSTQSAAWRRGLSINIWSYDRMVESGMETITGYAGGTQGFHATSWSVIKTRFPTQRGDGDWHR